MTVNIIGAGLSGLSAALTLAEGGHECNLISLQTSERAQSVMAEGGINACLNTMGQDDKIEYHIEDTMRGGVWLADPNAVDGLCGNAPKIVKRLASLGVPFSYNEKGIVQRSFGGQKKKRTAYVKSSTGKMLMTALIDEVRKYEVLGLVHRYPHHRFNGLVTEENQCFGAVITDEYSGEQARLFGSVILASGGMNGLFDGLTTGTTQNTGDAAAIVFEQGVELANLEFIQYHPTTIGIQGKRLLISEAARGEGGRLFVNRRGEKWYFMEEKYPELKNLMPRDVVSAEIVSVTSMPDCENQVYLDMTEISKDAWKKRLSDLREQCVHYLNIDPAETPVPVSPGIHYFMGGIWVDEAHRASVKNLYAAGECACQYHGANRLGGNSLLGAVYGGEAAAKSAVKFSSDLNFTEKNAAVMPSENVSARTAEKITEILYGALRIVRSEKEINNAVKELKNLLTADLNGAEVRRINLALATLECALNRKESRGAHKRSDYPNTDDINYKKQTVVKMTNGKTEVSLREIPRRRKANETNGCN